MHNPVCELFILTIRSNHLYYKCSYLHAIIHKYPDLEKIKVANEREEFIKKMPEKMRKGLELIYQADYYKADFRPDTPYAGSAEQANSMLAEAGADLSGLRMFAKEMLSEFHEEESREKERQMPIPAYVPQNHKEEYSVVTYAKASGMEPDYEPYPTRTLKTLSGFHSDNKSGAQASDYSGDSDEKRDSWGGICTGGHEATGFFHVEHAGDRFIMVDPEGNPYYNNAVTTVAASQSDRIQENALKKFGSMDGWAESAAARLRQLGFTGAGNWSDLKHLSNTKEKLGLCGVGKFLGEYGMKTGLAVQAVGHKVFLENNAMPVFEPSFADFSMEYAKKIAGPYRDDPHFIGWFSDNELPTNYNMLESFLTLNPNKECNFHSLAVAWEFLRSASGKENPTLQDVTEEDRQVFRGMVYDRYFRVVRTALRAAAPDHMYIGCRFSYLGRWYLEGTAMCREIMQAAGRWCDVITVNYYFNWTPDPEDIMNWEQWAKKPFIISEWYAMSLDSGLKCRTGAGFKVQTQKDRAAFYQNYALWLLECPWFVGFHWFMYMDNDPKKQNAEASNIDGNKGIVNTEFQEYTELTDVMKELNWKIWPLIHFFDARNHIGERKTNAADDASGL